MEDFLYELLNHLIDYVTLYLVNEMIMPALIDFLKQKATKIKRWPLKRKTKIR